VPRNGAASADPLARFLGFDPARDPDCVRLDPAAAPDYAPEPVVEEPVPVPAPVEFDALGSMSVEKALVANPRWVLLMALTTIFNGVKVDPRTGALPMGGRYGQARLATCWALRELGHVFRREVMASGWIVGKREGPHQ
jgi:hypothetical protein